MSLVLARVDHAGLGDSAESGALRGLWLLKRLAHGGLGIALRRLPVLVEAVGCLGGNVGTCAARWWRGHLFGGHCSSMLPSRGKAASHGEMRLLHKTAGGQLEW